MAQNWRLAEHRDSRYYTGMRQLSTPDFADPDVVEAYRSLECTISVGLEAPGSLQALVRATLHAYASALGDCGTRQDPAAWAAFVRCAAALYDALDRHGDPQWRRAATTLEQIVCENADLMPAG
jgi:hypothetical protein